MTILINQAVESLRITCRTNNYSPCTTKMAGYLHGLLKELAGVPKKYHYAVLEVVFGCEIYTFSQLTFQSWKALIDAFQSNADVPAVFYAIYHEIEIRYPADAVFIPGDFKDFLSTCSSETVYAF